MYISIRQGSCSNIACTHRHVHQISPAVCTCGNPTTEQHHCADLQEPMASWGEMQCLKQQKRILTESHGATTHSWLKRVEQDANLFRK